jgi:hypothetical protein
MKEERNLKRFKETIFIWLNRGFLATRYRISNQNVAL